MKAIRIEQFDNGDNLNREITFSHVRNVFPIAVWKLVSEVEANKAISENPNLKIGRY